MGRFRMIGFGCIVSLLGTTLLWLTAVIPQARPSCDQFSRTCENPTPSQLLFLCSCFGFMAIGAGGIRSCSMAFGTDQLDKRKDQNNAGILESYFSWYNVSVNISVLVALTCVVYIQEHFGWKVGFGIPALLMLLSAISFLSASPFYAKLKTKESVITRLAQVIVASYKNRDMQFSSLDTNEYYHIKGSMPRPSEKLRFLNKACIIRTSAQNLTPDGRISDPWSLCSVNQVENVKILIRILPIWSTGVLASVTVSQNAFPVLQASSMNRHITSNFEIPAGSFSIFVVISCALWLSFYDSVLIPVASKIKGKSVRLSSKERMGIGIFTSSVSLLIAAIVENIRRNKAIQQGISDDPKAIVNMSAMWLLPQNIFIGITEAFNTIGQIEFFYSELPKSMASIALAFATLGRSVGSLLGSVVMSSVDGVTQRGNRESWVSTNLNKGHYDYYSLLLCGLGVVNLFYYFACSKAYGPCKGEEKNLIYIIAGDEGSDECDDH